jgi:hypothetical protein
MIYPSLQSYCNKDPWFESRGDATREFKGVHTDMRTDHSLLTNRQIFIRHPETYFQIEKLREVW